MPTPFAKIHSDRISILGEERLITEIRQWLGRATPPAPHGIGDDCAVLPTASKRQAITVDPVIYGRHFDENVPPRAVGAKLLKRNLSDLAAMGARPTAAVIALTMDPGVSRKWLEQFYRGLADSALEYEVPIVGGDVAQADGVLAASLTLLGQAAGSRMVFRKGGKIGDWIYVTGTLGGSLAGHHYTFKPRLAEGAWLASLSETRSLIDVSDGPAKDLRALMPKEAEPALNAGAIPISRAAYKMAKASGRPALDHALSDGEDYELLFTISKTANREKFEGAWRARFKTPLTCIGQIVRHGRRPAETIDLSQYHGYEHLR
ncbi:MAG: thiamine-phosphate kinase [Nibricoccus sp.]